MIQDFPHANARLAEVARHWADGEVSHETWRRERRNILREICAKRTDCQERAPLLMGGATRSAVEVPSSPVAPPPPAAEPVPVVAGPVESEVANEEVLTLALLLIAVIVGAILIFFLA